MRRSSAVVLTGSIFFLLALLVIFGQRLFVPWTFVDRQTNQDNGYFYRVEVKLSHDGEPLDFDYVVACNIRVTRWKDGSLSDDTTIAPRRMMRATKAGSAVLVDTPELCGLPGRPQLVTETGWVPRDLLPLIVWFDSASDLSRGWGYVGEAAYESPLSKLKFGGAHISVSSREEWQKWREKAKAEYVQVGELPGPWGDEQLYLDLVRKGAFPGSCQAMSGYALPQKVGEAARPWMPSGTMTYWHTRDMPPEVRIPLFNAIGAASDPLLFGFAGGLGQFGNFNDDWAAGSGMPLRSGRQVQSPPHVATRWAPDYWPVLTPPESAPFDGTSTQYVFKALVGDDRNRGFARCSPNRRPERVSAVLMFDSEVIYREPRIEDFGGARVFRKLDYEYRYVNGPLF